MLYGLCKKRGRKLFLQAIFLIFLDASFNNSNKKQSGMYFVNFHTLKLFSIAAVKVSLYF